MTLTTSSRNKAAFGISGFTMKKNIGIIILTTVFMLLICPGYIFLSNERTDIFRNMRIFTDYVGTSITSVAILMSIISIFACFVNFSYLYSKKSVDVYHALPITRTRLLLARYFSAVIPLILPLLLCYGSLMAIVLINRVYACVSMILIGFAFAVAIMFMTAAFSLIFMICAGSIFDLLVSFAIINVGVLISDLILMDLSTNYLYGYLYIDTFSSLQKVSPFAFAYSKYVYAVEAVSSNEYTGRIWLYFAIILIITAVSICVSVLLYNRRKSEKSGESYAYKFIYYIASLLSGFICSYALGMIFTSGKSDEVRFWIFAVIGAMLASVTLGAITDRGFKTVKTSIKIGACAAVILVVTVVVLKLDVFGFSKRIPQESRIKSASISISDDEFNVDINDALAIHKRFIENRNAYEEKEFYTGVGIVYELKSGKKVERYYIIYDDNKLPPEIISAYKSDKRLNYIKKKFEKAKYADITVYNFDGKESDEFLDFTLNSNQVNELIDAYFSDLRALPDSDIDIQYDNGTSIDINYSSSDDKYDHYYDHYSNANFNIKRDKFPKTAAFIEEMAGK